MNLGSIDQIKEHFLAGRLSAKESIEYLVMFGLIRKVELARVEVNSWVNLKNLKRYSDNRKNIQRAFKGGKISKDKALDLLVSNGIDSKEDAEFNIKKWQNDKNREDAWNAAFKNISENS